MHSLNRAELLMGFMKRRMLYGLALFLTICAATTSNPTRARAQTPATANPTQQDATRPPGRERRQSLPQQSRPNTSDPTAPPGSERPAPQTPPGVTAVPQSSTQTTPAREASPGDASGNAADEVNTSAPPRSSEDSQRPLLESLRSRPVPPLPSLARLGIDGERTLSLSLNEAIRRALENNTEMEVARGDVRIAESSLRALEGVYEPIFQFTPQLSRFVTPQSSTLAGSDQSGTVSQTILDFGPSLTKLFRKGGGQYQFFFNNSRETINSTSAQFSPVYSANLGLTFTQPLLRNRAIDNNRRQILIQRKRLEQSDADFRRQTMDVIAQVQRAYWELVFALRDQQNRVANLNLIREQFRQTEQRIGAGATAPIERAEVQTELSTREADVLQAVQNVAQVENVLKRLIIRDPQAPEWAIAFVPTDELSFDAEAPINLHDALEEARANRPELHRVRLQQQITDIDVNYFRNQTRPRLDLQSTVSTTGLAGSVVNGSSTQTLSPSPLISGDPGAVADAFLLAQVNQLRAAQGLSSASVPLVASTTSASVPSNLVGGYGQMLRNLAGLKTHNIVVGVAIELPFHNKTARANLATARLEREQLSALLQGRELDVEIEVRNAAQAAEITRRTVLAARQSRENAEVQLEGEKRLYKVGQSTTFLLFQRENQLTNARNAELRAETDYNKALADLQRATSTTLRANHVVVQVP
jgi:outer membrane protein TolC